MLRGKYIVIEGGDGTGKSTQVELLKKRLSGQGISSIVIHEPDGFEGDSELGIAAVPEATELRKKIKDATIPRTPTQNVEWFTEARRLNWIQAMEPALKLGAWVLAARNWYSTVAYQGYGEGIDPQVIEAVTRQQVGGEYTTPDYALILNIANETVRQGRISNRGPLDTPDTFESKPDTFQQAMQTGYMKFAAEYNIEVLDASGTISDVEESIWERIEPLTKRGKCETIS